MLALGGYLVLHDRLTLGTFLAFSTYLAELAAPVRIVAGLLTIGQQARAGVVRVMEVIDGQPEIVDPADGVAPLGVRERRVEQLQRPSGVAGVPSLEGRLEVLVGGQLGACRQPVGDEIAAHARE